MNDELYRKIMNLFSHLIDNEKSEIVNFAELTDPDLEKVITVHPNEDGNLVLMMFDPEQWQMIENICQMTGKEESEVLLGIDEENLVKKLIIDPKNYPDNNTYFDF